MLDKANLILLNYLNIIPIIISSIIMLYISYLVSKFTVFLVKKILPKRMAPELRSFIPGASGVFAFILGIAITLKVVGLETGNLMTMLGLSTIAIGMSFKDVFVNTIQGVMIIINHTFSVGDEITVRDATGIVVKIDLMYTKIDTGTEIKYIPNSAMFSEIVTLKKK